MITTKILYFLILVIAFPISSSLHAQVLPEEPTLGDIANLKEDISNRSKRIPNNESEIFLERNWLTSARASIQKLTNDFTNQSKSPDLEKFKGELLKLVERINKINCGKVTESKSLWDDIKNEYNLLINDENIIDNFDMPKEWLVINQRFNKINQYFPSTFRPTPLSYTAAECNNLKNIFSQDQFKMDINSFIEKQKGKYDKNIKENSDKLNMLKLVEQEITSYSQKLSEALQKATTKNSLQTNLYLMILVIGLLSIATIGVVRLFPDKVMTEWVESGQVIQFVTVMILLSVIMTLGLAGLLSENTLGTLLGGIGGYVLSQGVGRSAARAALKEKKENEKITKE